MTDPKVYLDENNIRMLMNVRNSFVRLADGLVLEGKKDSAVKVLDRCNKLVPNSRVPYNYFNMMMVETYYKAGKKMVLNADSTTTIQNVNSSYIGKANEIIQVMTKNSEDDLLYYFTLKPDFRATVQEDLQRSYYIVKSLVDIANHYGEKQIGTEISGRLNKLLSVYAPGLMEPAKGQ
jgi:hypothetical protein